MTVSGLQVRLTIQVQIAIPVALGVVSLIYGNIVGGLIMLALAGLAALCFYLWCVLFFNADSMILSQADLARAQLTYWVRMQRGCQADTYTPEIICLSKSSTTAHSTADQQG